MRTRCLIVSLLVVVSQLYTIVLEPATVHSADYRISPYRPTIAYVHDNSKEAFDELSHLSKLPDKTYAHENFDSGDIDRLWPRISQFHVLIIELSGHGGSPIDRSLTAHRNELEDFIRAGGRLYVTLYGAYHDTALNWLPSSVQPDSIAPEQLTITDDFSTRLFSKPNVISEAYLNEMKDRQYASISSIEGVGYRSLAIGSVSSRTLIAYQTLGNGIIVVSGAELERGFHPEWVENIIDPLPIVVVVVGKVLIGAVAEYLVTEYVLKPVARPVINGIGQKYNITQIDEPQESDAIVDVATLAVSIRSIVKNGSKAIAQYGLARKATGQAVGGHMLWAYRNAIEALREVDKELVQEVIDQIVQYMTQSQQDDLTSQLSPAVQEQMDIANDFSYPYYLDNVMPEYAYTGYIDPYQGYSQSINVPQGTASMKIYVAWDVLFCGPFFILTDPYGVDRTPIPAYPDLNAVELRVDTPVPGIWLLRVNPLPQLANQDIGVVVDIEQPIARVLFDATHDEWFAANGDWSSFAAELRQVGFQVDVLTSGPITSGVLAPYDVFVFGGWAHTPPSSAELAAINQFVQSGGGLLLGYDEFTSGLYNSLSSYYGVEFIDEAGLNDPTDDEPGASAPVLHVFSTHPIFYNVDSVQFYWVHYLSRAFSPSTGVLFTDQDTVDQYGNLAAYKPMVATAVSGSGRVVSISDANLWNNWDWDQDGSADLYDRDNLQFGLNVIAWLAGMAPRPATGGLNMMQRESSEVPSRSSEGSLSGRPATHHIVKATEASATTDLGREHEEALLDSNGNVSGVVNTIALYGNGYMSITDTVPAGATIVFDEAPSSDYISGTQRILVWNDNVANYHQIAYTATNVSLATPIYANVAASLVPSRTTSSSQSTVYLKLTVDTLRDVPVLSAAFDVPKYTSQADVFIGETEVAAVSDKGDHYHLIVPLGPADKGMQRTVLIPLIISPKQLGTLTLIGSMRTAAAEPDATFLGTISYSPGSSVVASRSVISPLASLSLQITSQAVAQPVLQFGSDGFTVSVSQGQSTTRTLYIENVGTSAAAVNFFVSSPATKPDGTAFLNAAWVALPNSISLGTGISTTVILGFNVPANAGANTYIGTLNVSAGGILYQLPLQLNVSESGLIKHLWLDTNPDSVFSFTSTVLEVCVHDDFSMPVPYANIVLSGAAVDVAPGQTGANGCTSFVVRPLEAGTILAKGTKTGYVQGEDEIEVRPTTLVFLPVLLRNYQASTAYNWLDATSGGTIVAQGDDTYQYVSLPFPFSFYGNTYNGLYVSSNGFASFGTGYTTFSNSCLPSNSTPNNAIYAFWDDLVPTGGSNGNIYVKQINATTFVIEWYRVKKYGASDYQTFEIVLRSDNSITLQYQSISNAGSATVGVENVTGTLAKQLVCNGVGTPLTNQLAIRYTTP